ncbi:MAG: hypothetical protein ACOX3L_03010 [Lutisporaceae bacterium]
MILSADLSESGKSVLLRTTNMNSSSPYGIVVRDVCDLAGNSIARYREAFYIDSYDSKAPSITNREVGE